MTPLSVPTEQTASMTPENFRVNLLIELIGPQLHLLTIEFGKTPLTGSYVSKRSRGYIYGTAASILGMTIQNIDEKSLNHTMRSAFSLVWGDENAQDIFEKTLAECVARDGETLAGSYYAEAEIGEAYQGKTHAAVMGFWLLNNEINDPAEIMPVIENPSRLSKIKSRSLKDHVDSVYSLIRDGHKIDSIRRYFCHTDLDDQRIEDVIRRGKILYNSETDYLKNDRIIEGKFYVSIGLTLLIIGTVAFLFFSRVLIIGLPFGFAALLNGLWHLGTAEPKGRRTDLE